MEKEIRLNVIHNRTTSDVEGLECKIGRYIQHTKKNEKYTHGDLDCSLKEWKQWMYICNEVSIYIITNDFEDYDTQTHVGCTSQLEKRFRQHNGDLPGGPQNTKRAAGHWSLIFYMKIPPLRNYSCKDIIKQIDISRGLPSRCKKMLNFARDIGAEFKISPLILRHGSIYYSEVVEDIITKNYTKEEIKGLLINDKKYPKRKGNPT